MSDFAGITSPIITDYAQAFNILLDIFSPDSLDPERLLIFNRQLSRQYAQMLGSICAKHRHLILQEMLCVETILRGPYQM